MRFLVDPQLPAHLSNWLNDRGHDSLHTHLLRGRPKQLLIVATGNITNNELLASFEQHLETVVSTFDDADLVELRPDQLITRPRA